MSLSLKLGYSNDLCCHILILQLRQTLSVDKEGVLSDSLFGDDDLALMSETMVGLRK